MQAHLLVLLPLLRLPARKEVEETLPLTAHWLSKDACLIINLFAITSFQKKKKQWVHGQFLCAKNSFTCPAYSRTNKLTWSHFNVCNQVLQPYSLFGQWWEGATSHSKTPQNRDA